MTGETSEIDYWAIEVPDDTPPEEYHYTVRRAELLRMVIRNGSPYRLNQTQLGARYDVDRSTISRDLDAIDDSIKDALGNRAALTARAAVEDVIDTLDDAMDQGDWRAAEAKFRVIMGWNEYLADRGAINREPQQIDADVTHRDASETDSYRIIEDPDDIDAELNGSDPIPVEGLPIGDDAPTPDADTDSNHSADAPTQETDNEHDTGE